MSKIINEAKIKNPLVVKIRELLEHRAFWLYLLTDEAEKRGLDPTDFASGRDLKMRYFSGYGSCEKGRHQEPQGAEKDAFHQGRALGL